VHGIVKRLAAIALVCLAAAAPAGAGPPSYGVVEPNARPGTPLHELGYQLYAGNCSTCHGSDGRGIVRAEPGEGSGGVTAKAPSLRNVGELAPDFYLRTGRMPLGQVGDEPLRSHPFFSEHQIQALVAYVGSLGHGPPIPHPHPERGSLSEGLRLFTQHCAGCHQVAGAGGYLTSAVAVPLGDATTTQIAEAVRIGPYVMPRFSKRQISDAELNSIVRYVRYTRNPNDSGGWSLGRVGPITEGLVAWLIAGVLLVATCLVIGRRLRA
jgi:quinol---cytochrome-c reductase cytochrome c subunit